MTIKNGTFGLVRTGANTIANLNQWSSDDGVQEVTARVFGSTLATSEAGVRGITGNMSGYYDPDDVNGQGVLIPGAKVACDFHEEGNDSGDEFDRYTEIIILNIQKGVQVDNFVSFTATWRANVLPTRETVP